MFEFDRRTETLRRKLKTLSRNLTLQSAKRARGEARGFQLVYDILAIFTTALSFRAFSLCKNFQQQRRIKTERRLPLGTVLARKISAIKSQVHLLPT